METKHVHVTMAPALLGKEMTASVSVDGRETFFLHSRYNPSAEAQDWLKTLQMTTHTLYIVLGFGIGHHIKALLHAMDRTSRIIVVEPTVDCSPAAAAMQYYKGETWISDSRLEIRCITNPMDVSVSVSTRMVEEHLYQVVVCPYFPAMAIFPNYYQTVRKNIHREISEGFRIHMDYHLKNKSFLFENAWRNIGKIIRSPGTLGFQNSLQGVPAIIVGAGPSLKKNIHLLQQCKERGLLIACGSTMKVLADYGVRPHILAVADPFPEASENLINCLTTDTAILSAYDSAYEMLAQHQGKIYFALTQGINILERFQNFFPATGTLRKSISVTTMAVDFARQAGCNPIVFVGQDLAYEGKNKRYADGVNQVFIDDTNYLTEVPGADGSVLTTPTDLRAILMYLQEYIKQYPGTDFINATEGGALISGAMHLPLAEVLHSSFQQPFLMDMGELPEQDEKGFVALDRELKNIQDELYEFCEAVHSDSMGLEPFINKIQKNKGISILQAVIDPVIMACRIRMREQVPGAENDEEMLRQRCLYWIGFLQEVIRETRMGLQENLDIGELGE